MEVIDGALAGDYSLFPSREEAEAEAARMEKAGGWGSLEIRPATGDEIRMHDEDEDEDCPEVYQHWRTYPLSAEDEEYIRHRIIDTRDRGRGWENLARCGVTHDLVESLEWFQERAPQAMTCPSCARATG